MSKNGKGKGNEKNKHFYIPDTEVKREEAKRKKIPKPVNIDFNAHSKEIREGIDKIKKNNVKKNNPIHEEIIFFQLSLANEEVVDSRGNFEDIFKKNNIQINAVRGSNVAIASIKYSDFEKLEGTIQNYQEHNGKKNMFWSCIEKISPVDKDLKKSKRVSMHQDEVQDKTSIDAQITLVPNLSSLQYEKVISHLLKVIRENNGTVENEGVYYLSDNTPIVRAYLSSSAINQIVAQEAVLDVDITHHYEGSENRFASDYSIKDIPLLEDEITKLPIVCVLDDGIKLPHNLKRCVAGSWKPNDLLDGSGEHGTKVASRVIFGDNIKQQVENKLLVPKVRVIEAIISDGKAVTEQKIISRIHKAVKDIKGITRTFCLSFNDNSSSIAGETFVSNLAYELDRICIEEGVNIAISAGNHDLWKKYTSIDEITSDSFCRVASPAESFYGTVVGSITTEDHPDSLSGSKTISPFSRIGYGFADCYKPDLVYPGGNVYKKNGREGIAPDSGSYVIDNKGNLVLDFGTSFSAPLASQELELLNQEMNKYFKEIKDTTNLERKCLFLSKGLLLHHAQNVADMSMTSSEDYNRLYGCGQGDFKNAKASLRHRPTYLRYGTLNRKTKEKVKILIPEILAEKSKKSKKLARISVTCFTISPVDKNKGTEYLRAYVSSSLHKLNSNGNLDTQNPPNCNGRKKWSHIQHFVQDFTVFGAGDWEIWLELYTKPEIDDTREIEYVLIVTIESLYEEPIDVYQEIELSQRYNVLQEIIIDDISLKIENR